MTWYEVLVAEYATTIKLVRIQPCQPFLNLVRVTETTHLIPKVLAEPINIFSDETLSKVQFILGSPIRWLATDTVLKTVSSHGR